LNTIKGVFDMARNSLLRPSFLAGALLATVLGIAGCMSAHPDDKSSVIDALGSNSMYSVMVAQDRHKGVITLTGDVGSDDAKVQAATIAQTAAPGYSIDNRINVISTGLSAQNGAAASSKPKPRASGLKLASAKVM
jgi:hyperosmotically inducible protein